MKSFEGLCVRIAVNGESFIFLTIYRPGSVRPSSLFFDELTTVIETLVLQSCPVLVGGDFNIHVEESTDPDAVRLSELFSSFDMTQHIDGPTHRHGGTLDLVATFSHYNVSDVCIDPAGIVSDHGMITCRLPSRPRSTNVTTQRVVRSWRNVDRQVFCQAIADSPLGCPSPLATAAEMFSTYESVLREIADRLAPSHTVRSRVRPLSPWFDSECRAIRRDCRRLERRYRRTNDNGDRCAWTKAVRQKNIDFQAKKDGYWTERVSRDAQSSSKLWQSMSKILRRDKDAGSRQQTGTTATAESFANFFDRKIKDVRAGTDDCPPSTSSTSATSRLVAFQECSPSDIRRLIMSSPTKSCILDPIPTFLLKESVDALLPFLTVMINASLREGHLPASQKHAVITPLLKKSSLEAADMKNYRPVSNLTFISKLTERIVSEQLVQYFSANNLMPRLQSAYRRRHSTETALLRVLSDILSATDKQCVTLLGLLDLSAAFDCVDHEILIDRLHKTFGLDGVVLAWMTSFLDDRTQQVSYNGFMSTIVRLLYGVPQGSCLGPLLYLLYTAELFDLIENCGMKAHCYADDTQVYISSPAVDASAAVIRFQLCVEQIERWLRSNRLKMNAEKTQVIWLGTRQQLAKVNISEIGLSSAVVHVSDSVVDLGVSIDSQLTMSKHVASVCRSCCFQLRQLRAVRRSLTMEAAKTLVHAFVGGRLD